MAPQFRDPTTMAPQDHLAPQWEFRTCLDPRGGHLFGTEVQDQETLDQVRGVEVHH